MYSQLNLLANVYRNKYCARFSFQKCYDIGWKKKGTRCSSCCNFYIVINVKSSQRTNKITVERELILFHELSRLELYLNRHKKIPVIT